MLHLELGPELEARLQQQAAVRGVTVEELVRKELEEKAVRVGHETSPEEFGRVLDRLQGIGGEQVKRPADPNVTYDRAMIYQDHD
ncbi:MAG: hypothetical protein NVS9B15_18150 [Acidobacteriaceae bacterium]